MDDVELRGQMLAVEMLLYMMLSERPDLDCMKQGFTEEVLDRMGSSHPAFGGRDVTAAALPAIRRILDMAAFVRSKGQGHI